MMMMMLWYRSKMNGAPFTLFCMMCVASQGGDGVKKRGRGVCMLLLLFLLLFLLLPLFLLLLPFLVQQKYGSMTIKSPARSRRKSQDCTKL